MTFSHVRKLQKVRGDKGAFTFSCEVLKKEKKKKKKVTDVKAAEDLSRG